MSITNRIFNNTKITIINSDDEIWFKSKPIAQILGYVDTDQAVRYNVDSEDKKKLSEFRPVQLTGLNNEYNEKKSLYINESGLYSLILKSKLESAKVFKRWVTKDVLPSIRKTGAYTINHMVKENLIFKIENETDLHTKTVSFVKKRFPNSIFTVTLGENQDSSEKRIDSFKKGYLKGSPDLIINNLHKYYSGLVIEFKTPKGNGRLSKEQINMLHQYKLNNFKVLVSNDYDFIIEQLIEYFRDVRIKCTRCSNKFKSTTTLIKHNKYFHRIS